MKTSTKSTSGTYYLTEVAISYNELVELFGEPNRKGDEYKTSAEWVLEDDEGRVLTIYDWKETNLYSHRYPTPEEFYASPNQQWHIGGTNREAGLALAKYIKSSQK